jgi:multiple sugar transport system substrate-binding protein
MQPECSALSVDFSAPSRAALLLGIVLTALLTAGCATSVVEPVPARTFEGVRVTVCCPDEASAALVERHGRAWSDRTGATVTVSRAPLAESATADAWLIAPADLASWAAAGRLRPVPEAALRDREGYKWDGQLPLYRDKLLRWGKTPYALPVLGEAPVCLYRDDLFRDPKHQAGFRERWKRPLPADGPATWQDFAEAAEYFREALGGPSLPPLPAEDDGLDRLFGSVAAPLARRGVSEENIQKSGAGEEETARIYEFHYDTRKGGFRCRLDSQGFVEALKLLQRLQACRHAGQGGSPAGVFRSGKAVLWLTTLAELGKLQADPGPVQGKVGVCRRVPGSRVVAEFDTGKLEEFPGGNFVPYVGAGGRLGVVPAGAAHPEAGLDLLAELAGPRVSLEVLAEPRWGAGPTREAHLDPNVNRYCWSAYGLDEAQTAALADALRQAVFPPPSNPVARLRTPDQETHLRALTEEVRKALTTPNADAAQAMKAAADRWRKLDEGQPAEALRKNYLRSLSLAP